MRKLSAYIIVLLFVLAVSLETSGQYFKLRGTVYDSTRSYPLISVSVLSTSGKGTATDVFGRYEIEVKESDSIWFSYLNKPTIKFAVGKIFDASRFDIALHVNVQVLKEVIVKPRNYKLDSLRNREDYAKGFNWEKPRLQPTLGNGVVGFSVEEIIRMFQFRKNRSAATFKERLLQEERDKFIDHRFNKALVLRLTGLIGAERDSFMSRCRPTYEFCVYTNDYDFQFFIKQCYEAYKLQKSDAWLQKEN